MQISKGFCSLRSGFTTFYSGARNFLSKIWRMSSNTLLGAHIRDVINRSVQTGSANKGKSPGRPSVSGKVVDGLDDSSRIRKHL